MRALTNRRLMVWLVSILSLSAPLALWANEGEATGGTHEGFALVFLFLAVIIISSKIGGLVERLGQPPVLGELLVGIILGNIGLLGWHFFDAIRDNQFIAFLSELGVVILLFQIGLESNLAKMRSVGLRAFIVAVVGVVLPFVLGTYLVGPWLFPGQSFNTYLFLGATLTATSVGITARVFKDLGKVQTREAQIVLGAAVIDDVLGLLVLAVVSAIVAVGSVSLGDVGLISAKAVIFLAAAIGGGIIVAPFLGKWLSRIHSGVGMKVGLALSFGLTFAYLAAAVGLAPIVGAFAAGLVLDPVHFRWFKSAHFIDRLRGLTADSACPAEFRQKLEGEINHQQDRHVEELIEDIAHFLVPIFFVYTGMLVDLRTFLDPRILLLALGVTIAAFVGKLFCGAVAGRGVQRMIIGVGMIPRGEVGLIFASVGAALGVVTPAMYSVIVIMVIVSTLVPPPILAALLKRQPVSSV